MPSGATKPPPVIVIVGPTASGKTSLSIALAQILGAEVVSADSRQVYRYLDIGTAKPTLSERKGIPHYGFDVADPNESYSAGRFAEEARAWIEDILTRGKPAIVAGGSGLYLEALIHGFFQGDDIRDDDVREELETRASEYGLDVLYKELQTADPVYAEKTKPNDRQRILRALEVTLAAGEPFSALHERERNPAPFQSIWFGLDLSREMLYGRIDRRVEVMLDRGLVREVQDLVDRGFRNANALKSVGYEEVIDWMDGVYGSLDETVEAIQRNTRRYAKRQLTWFRRYPKIEWLSADRSLAELVDAIQSRLNA